MERSGQWAELCGMGRDARGVVLNIFDRAIQDARVDPSTSGMADDVDAHDDDVDRRAEHAHAHTLEISHGRRQAGVK